MAVKQSTTGRDVHDPVSEAVLAQSAAAAPSQATAPDHTPTALVVEQDPDVAQRLRDCLESAGCRVSEAQDAHASLQRCREEGPDLVVCGMSLVQQGGFSLLGAFVQTRVPVVLITRGGESQDDIDAALRAGARDLISQQYLDTEVARHLVNRTLEMVRLRAENRRQQARLEQLNVRLRRKLDQLEQDQKAGRRIQLKMLPDTPCQMGEYRFEHRMFPSLLLAGDYVDYYSIGDHHAAFFVADVSGHGASSAFVTVLLKHITARARSALGRLGDRTVLSPAASIARLNEELLASDLGKHVTMCAGVLNRRSNHLRYCVAGHLPLPILIGDGEARYLEGGGLPVGLFPEATFKDKRLRLPERFSLLLSSDGLLEAMPGNDVNEQERLLLECFRDGDPGLDGLIARIGVERASKLADDITLLRITRD